ncbi:MAG: hypothetical protein NTW10_15150 [Bacteroidetes bacterium]|nr:hypothetical protein [Bacteroidota bacterium]
MKKLVVLFLSLFIMGAIFISSCKKSSSTPGVTYSQIGFKTGSGYISSNQTIQGTSTLLFGINASGGDYILKRFLVMRTFKTKPSVVKDTSFTLSSFSYDLHTIARPIAGDENWDFKIFNSRGDSLTLSLVITTTSPPPAGPIFKWATKVIGAQISTSGNFFSSSDGIVHSMKDAKINAARIDWAYFYDAGDQATWPTITNDSMIVIQNQSGVTLPKITNLGVNEYYAFTTAGGKKGMIKIDAVTPDVTGTITIDVKVQQ